MIHVPTKNNIELLQTVKHLNFFWRPKSLKRFINLTACLIRSLEVIFSCYKPQSIQISSPNYTLRLHIRSSQQCPFLLDLCKPRRKLYRINSEHSRKNSAVWGQRQNKMQMCGILFYLKNPAAVDVKKYESLLSRPRLTSRLMARDIGTTRTVCASKLSEFLQETKCIQRKLYFFGDVNIVEGGGESEM